MSEDRERASPRTSESRHSSFRDITNLDIIPESEEHEEEDQEEEQEEEQQEEQLEEQEEEELKEEVGEDAATKEENEDLPSEARSQTGCSSVSTVVSHPEDILLPEGSEVRDYINQIDRESVIISEEEVQAWDRQMQEQEEQMNRYSQDFKDWEATMNQRKLVAFGRLKNLTRCHNKRMDFYETFKNYVKQMEEKVINKTDTQKSFTGKMHVKDTV